MEIIVPSYKRARECVTPRWIKRAKIAVHTFEAEDYRRYSDNELIEMPDEIAGKGMATVRNWILDHAESDEVVMLDDDIKDVGFVERLKYNMMVEEEVYGLLDMGFAMCREAGTVLWGVNLIRDRKAYREYSPFSLSSIVLGPFFCVIKNDLRFDETLGLKEDYDYSIQVLRRYRRILRFNKYYYGSDHIKKRGGCAAYRTVEAEKEQMGRLAGKWGTKIVEIRSGDINPIIRAPIHGI